jgi:peroxiredoxin
MAELSDFRLHPGDSAPPFRLPGTDGRTWSLEAFAPSPWLLVVFHCNHCPYAQAWEGRLIQLQRELGPRGLATVLINPNETEHYPDDRMERMVERAREKGYPFPYLRDDSQEVARAYGALVTPHPMLFDARRRLVYQGAIDDDHARPERVRHAYLREALDAAMAGRPISPAERPVIGCSVKWRA